MRMGFHKDADGSAEQLGGEVLLHVLRHALIREGILVEDQELLRVLLRESQGTLIQMLRRTIADRGRERRSP